MPNNHLMHSLLGQADIDFFERLIYRLEDRNAPVFYRPLMMPAVCVRVDARISRPSSTTLSCSARARHG